MGPPRKDNILKHGTAFTSSFEDECEALRSAQTWITENSDSCTSYWTANLFAVPCLVSTTPLMTYAVVYPTAPALYAPSGSRVTKMCPVALRTILLRVAPVSSRKMVH